MEQAKKSFWKRNGKKIAAALIFLVFAAAGYFFFFREDSKEENDEKIQTAQAEKGDISLVVTGSGQVQAKTQVDLRPQVAGDGLDIVQIAVKNNQEVKKGDLVAVLDSTEARKAISDATLALRSAEIALKQTADEFSKETKDDKYQRQAKEIAVEQKKIALKNAYDDLKDYSIRAPFDGMITGLEAEAGDSIARDEVLASVITKEQVALVSLNEVDAAKVKVGSSAKLDFDAFDKLSVKGEVSKIDTIGTVEQGVVYYDAEIAFDNSKLELKPGMSVSVEILVAQSKDVVLIPAAALKENNQDSFVQVLLDSEGKEIKKVVVKTGLSDGVNVEITSGLEAGQNVIVKGASANNSQEQSGSRGLFDSAVRAPGGGQRR